MDKLLEELLAVLQKQLGCYLELLELTKSKQPVLVAGKVDELDNIVKKEEVLIFEVGRLEEMRRVIHQALANHFALSPEELTLSEVIKRVDGETGKQLNIFLDKMSETLKQLTELNNVNSELIKSSLNYINFSLNLLAGGETAPSYPEREAAGRRAAAKIFDRKI